MLLLTAMWSTPGRQDHDVDHHPSRRNPPADLSTDTLLPQESSFGDCRRRGHRQRPLPRSEKAAKGLRTRTLTNLYNDRPQWLADAYAALEVALAAAYGPLEPTAP